MKRMLSLLLFIIAVFTSACGVNTNSKKGDPQVRIENYLSDIKQTRPGRERYIADFDLYQYLIDYGATEIWRIETEEPSAAHIGVRFKNKLIAIFYFSGPLDNPYAFGWLNAIIVLAADDDYRGEDWISGYDKEAIGVRSDWSRYFSGTSDLITDDDYLEKYDKGQLYTVVPNKMFYMVNSNGEKTLVAVPEVLLKLSLYRFLYSLASGIMHSFCVSL